MRTMRVRYTQVFLTQLVDGQKTCKSKKTRKIYGNFTCKMFQKKCCSLPTTLQPRTTKAYITWPMGAHSKEHLRLLGMYLIVTKLSCIIDQFSSISHIFFSQLYRVLNDITSLHVQCAGIVSVSIEINLNESLLHNSLAHRAACQGTCDPDSSRHHSTQDYIIEELIHVQSNVSNTAITFTLLI